MLCINCVLFINKFTIDNLKVLKTVKSISFLRFLHNFFKFLINYVYGFIKVKLLVVNTLHIAYYYNYYLNRTYNKYIRGEV